MKFDWLLSLLIILLLIISYLILKSVNPLLFPSYYWYIGLGILAFLFFSFFDFEIISAFYKYFYIISIILLIAVLVIGEITRGTVRWIPVGSISIQPSEIVRPFLLLFFANYIAYTKLDFAELVKILLWMALPLFLILVQPSLGVCILTATGFVGLFLASRIDKKIFIYLGLTGIVVIPILFMFLRPYQKDRLLSFIDPAKDPLGSGYNAIQSTISVGSGKWLGRGLGRGVGTQLAFLPEHSTDFVFASIAEEMGFVGAFGLLVVTFLLLFRIVSYTEKAINIAARLFLGGFVLTFFLQLMIHVGMNMGLFPITGVPYPLISAGGSSLLASMISLGIVMRTKKG